MHRVLDVTFREDDCRVRKGHAARNLSAVRKFALSALRNDTLHPDRSLRRRRKLADRRPDYRASLLGLIPMNSPQLMTSACAIPGHNPLLSTHLLTKYRLYKLDLLRNAD
jgi:hypothetical protein